MFLMKAIQDQYLQSTDPEDSVAFVIFNVKGKDLMAIDVPNDFGGDVNQRDSVFDEYKSLGLSTEPFKHVKYFIPFTRETSPKISSYLSKEDVDSYVDAGRLLKFKYTYEDDKESIEMMFADTEDSTGTMESIISKVIDQDDPDFSKLTTWSAFRDKVSEKSVKGGGDKGEAIMVTSWRKFKRILNKALQDDMFANRPNKDKAECRLADQLKSIKPNDVFVIDVAKMQEDKQAFVFGDAVRTLYNLKLGEYDGESGVKPPSRIVIFIDELNKYASKDVPKSSPILRELLDVTERGRSLGVILFAAEQFRSAIHNRVTGNCATHAYGRTTAIETGAADYKSLPNTYKNMLTRLNQGDYLIQNPIFRSLLKIQFPRPIYKQFK
jgi:DNA helicase HerA-like ATPase